MKLPRQLYSFAGIFIFVSLSWLILSLLGLFRQRKQRKSFQTWSYRATLRIWGIKVKVEGEVAPPPVFLLANHCSYIDVAILGALGAMRFTPKSDVKSWPVIGQMVQSYDVVFVDRVPGKAKKAQSDLRQALHEGDRICVFPEGTTSNGRILKPFKPTLLSLAEQWEEAEPLSIQPVIIRYDLVDGKPMDDKAWDTIAWYGEIDLISHLWRFCGLKRIDATVCCLPPITLQEGENRKQLSERVRQAMLEKLPFLEDAQKEIT